MVYLRNDFEKNNKYYLTYILVNLFNEINNETIFLVSHKIYKLYFWIRNIKYISIFSYFLSL